MWNLSNQNSKSPKWLESNGHFWTSEISQKWFHVKSELQKNRSISTLLWYYYQPITVLEKRLSHARWTHLLVHNWIHVKTGYFWKNYCFLFRFSPEAKENVNQFLFKIEKAVFHFVFVEFHLKCITFTTKYCRGKTDVFFISKTFVAN